MIELKEIKKSYIMADETIEALKGIDIKFRDKEFVSIVGPSGCGKTTLLNVIGGLDQYTSGDLLIGGKSTKSYKDTDWDSYRNSTVGFVFQTYNLIPHLNVIENVMMALSLSGVNYKERYERAKKVLTDVGLENKLKKKPNQLSGGQMQRVAIARALVNNPKILLADEPTGALDSKTSVQIMDLIKKIANDRLVIMVTHNEELAKDYSDRIVELLDGQIIKDSNICNETIEETKEEGKTKKLMTKMSFWEALKSSFKNLFLKKGRTIATSVAGSIGIIGIGLVLSLSSGINLTVNRLQSDALAGFPITISSTVTTTNKAIDAAQNKFSGNNNSFPTDNVFHYYDMAEDLVAHTNKIDENFLEYLNQMNPEYYNSISYTKGVAVNIIYKTESNTYGRVINGTSSIIPLLSTSVMTEIPNSKDFILSQYDVLVGKYPENFNELVLIVDEENNINISVLNSFGIDVKNDYLPEDLIGRTFKVVGNNDYYYLEDGVYKASTDYQAMFNNVSDNSFDVSIVGIMRIKESSSTEFLSNGIGYSYLLTDKLIENAQTSDIVLAQKDNTETNVLTGNAFTAKVTYDSVMKTIGGNAIPTSIQIYPKTFELKDKIKQYLNEYNKNKSDEDKIVYTDLAEALTSTIMDIVNIITIVLSIIAAISLLVSSIMISIIIYVSVIERTKEIGVMRSIGARKKDVARIFSAEAITIGLISGVIGVIISYILDLPLSLIVSQLLGSKFVAILPIQYAILLVVISVLLTFIAGILPSRKASKKDPVTALRTE